MIAETFLTLLKDPAHWAFEALTDVVFGVILGGVVWPRIKNHIHRDVQHGELHASLHVDKLPDSLNEDVHVRVLTKDEQDAQALHLLMWGAGVSLPKEDNS